MPPVIDADACKRCYTCADVCPMHVLSTVKSKKVPPTVDYADECWHCNACALDCPVGAISLRFPVNYMLLHVKAETLVRK